MHEPPSKLWGRGGKRSVVMEILNTPAPPSHHVLVHVLRRNWLDLGLLYFVKVMGKATCALGYAGLGELQFSYL